MPEFASVDQIRRRFPALARRHNGHPVAYFDGPGGTQVPRRVVDAMTEYLLQHNANTHWAYPSSQETDQALFEARGALADWIGGSADEIVFGANMTTLTFHLGRALGREWRAGDVVVVTELDHHANSDTWRALAKERGVEVRTIRMRPQDGCLDAEDLERKLTPGTRLLAVGAASNALGTINDVGRLVKQAGQRFAVTPDNRQAGIDQRHRLGRNHWRAARRAHLQHGLQVDVGECHDVALARLLLQALRELGKLRRAAYKQQHGRRVWCQLLAEQAQLATAVE